MSLLCPFTFPEIRETWPVDMWERAISGDMAGTDRCQHSFHLSRLFAFQGLHLENIFLEYYWKWSSSGHWTKVQMIRPNIQEVPVWPRKVWMPKHYDSWWAAPDRSSSLSLLPAGDSVSEFPSLQLHKYHNDVLFRGSHILKYIILEKRNTKRVMIKWPRSFSIPAYLAAQANGRWYANLKTVGLWLWL